MDVKFITTTSARLSELSVVSGQLIYLSDINATYYDMGGTRRLMSSMRLVPALPSTSAAQGGVLYGVVNAAGRIDASVWDANASTYRALSGYVATTSSLGLVKPDGTTITIDANGTISCHAEVTSLPASSVTYDNTGSGMVASEVQDAIDELHGLASTAFTAASDAGTAAAAAATVASNASTLATQANTAASNASTAANKAITDSANASTLAQNAQNVAAAASTAAQLAVTSATNASTAANKAIGDAAAATTLAQAGYNLASAASTAISDHESRLQAVEAIAAIALTIESSSGS